MSLLLRHKISVKWVNSFIIAIILCININNEWASITFYTFRKLIN